MKYLPLEVKHHSINQYNSDSRYTEDLKKRNTIVVFVPYNFSHNHEIAPKFCLMLKVIVMDVFAYFCRILISGFSKSFLFQPQKEKFYFPHHILTLLVAYIQKPCYKVLFLIFIQNVKMCQIKNAYLWALI